MGDLTTIQAPTGWTSSVICAGLASPNGNAQEYCQMAPAQSIAAVIGGVFTLYYSNNLMIPPSPAPYGAVYDVAHSSFIGDTPPKIERDVEYVPLTEIRTRSRRLVLSKSIDLELCNDTGAWHYMCMSLGLGGAASSRAGAIRAFAREAIFFWGVISQWSDELLTPGARTTRDKILAVVDHSIPARLPRRKLCYGTPVITEDVAPYIHYPYWPDAKLPQ